MPTTTREKGTVLRASRGVWTSQLGIAAVDAALGAYWFVAWTTSWQIWIGVAFLAAAVWSSGQAVWFSRLRVNMTDDGVTVGAFRRRTYAWEDVSAVEQERRFWVTHRVVTITPVGGEPVTVLAKGGWLDDGFDTNHRQLESRWRRQTRRDVTDL